MAKQAEYKTKEGHTFRGLVSAGSCPEVCGWLEDADHNMIRETYGFYRTADLHEAARRCATIFGYTLVD